MNASDIPAKFPVAFASSAGSSYTRAIPQAPVTPTTSDAPASLHDGFPPACFTPQGSGGVPPNGADFNGLLNQITAWSRWQAAGAPAFYDSVFSAAVGGYPKGAQLASTVTPGLIWISTADGNTTNPDGGSPANWVGAGAATSGSNANGYWEVHPNGIIEQWGTVAVSNGTFNFPIPFLTGCTGFFPTNSSAQGIYVDNAYGYAISKTQFFCATKNSNSPNVISPYPVAWLAKGR